MAANISQLKDFPNLCTTSGDLKYEIERLLTFHEVTHPKLTSVQLSGNGFYYDMVLKKILCYFCKTVLKTSESILKHKHTCIYTNYNIPVHRYDDVDNGASQASNINNELRLDNIASSNSEENKNDMFDYQNRLDTYKKWPQNIPVKPEDLAQSGFYFLGYSDVVECAYCSVELRNWADDDIVHDEHIRESPRCPNLQISALSKMDLKSELNRIKSFVKWLPSHPLKPNDLAKNGFYHKGPGDNVSCVFCKCELRNWKANDNIEEKHRTSSPNCPFLCDKKVGNEPIAARSKILFERPMHPNLALLSERLKTFANWPKDKKQRPEDLAEAGFFHNGKSDTVICFSCGGGLDSWDEEDIPWKSHAQHFPQCTFVLQMKIPDFIASKSMKNEVTSYSQDSCSQDDVEENAEIPEDFTTFPNTPKLAILPMDRSLKLTQSCLDTPTVLAVLSMGYKKSIVKKVVKNKIKDTGSSFSKASVLLEAIHKCPDFEADVEEVSDEEEPHTQTDAIAEAKSVTGSALVKENIMLKEFKLCKICLDKELSVVFLPCGHLVTCESCGPSLNICPVCQKDVHGLVKTYF